MIIKQTAFWTLQWEISEIKLLIFDWSTESSKINNDLTYQESMYHLAEVIQGLEFQFMLSDASKLAFVITPVMQKFTTDLIDPILTEKRLIKLALVMPEEFIPSLATEQLIDQIYNKTPYQISLFSTRPQAFQWLKNRQTQGC